MTIYSIYAAFVNIGPNIKIIGYSYIEQIRDITPSLILSVLMALAIWPIEELPLPIYLVLVIQILTGASFYAFFAYLFRLEPFEYLVKFIVSKIEK